MIPNLKQHNLHHQPLSQQKGQQKSSQSDYSDNQLDPQLLAQTLKTIKKLKKISKQKKLTELKSTNKTVNNIFKNISQIFFFKSKIGQQKRRQRKKLKQLRKQALKKVGIRNTENLQKSSGYKNYGQNSQQQQIQEFSYNQRLKQFNVQINSLKCYVCKQNFTNVHNFYDCLCPDCGDFNYSKRNQTADFKDFIALVTGARIKIGFQISLKLLRDGATVIATSRFFKDTFLRYSKQKDYHIWAERLFIIQCDFTSSPQVSHLIAKIKQKFTRIDILINNAAQTIVRPKQFYLQQLVNSTKQLTCLPAHLLEFEPLKNQQVPLPHRYPSLYLPQKQSVLLQLQSDQSSPNAQIQKLGQSNKDLIDHNVRDEFDQPLDKRDTNSWVQNLDDVSLIDCYSTQLVNSIVPFHLISQLKQLMKKAAHQNPSFIINVSSMQGVFNRANKQSTHPHTNMAKAALNMITRTSAHQFSQDHIYMSSVDTGWVTEQNPTTMKLQRHVPLDCLDGAMRVLDPIYTWRLTGHKLFGKFLKDYKQSNW